jgi:predicted nucleotidyltransferase
MVEFLRSKHDAIAAACARHSVLRLEAFGSALRDDFVPGQSDVDLLVEFESLESYALVDAVKNPYIARAIEREKQLLYAA